MNEWSFHETALVKNDRDFIASYVDLRVTNRYHCTGTACAKHRSLFAGHYDLYLFLLFLPRQTNIMDLISPYSASVRFLIGRRPRYTPHARWCGIVAGQPSIAVIRSGLYFPALSLSHRLALLKVNTCIIATTMRGDALVQIGLYCDDRER